MTVPETAMVLDTRAALGIGLGLLLANHMTEEGRSAVGRTLLVAGVFTGAVLATELFARPRPFRVSFGTGAEPSAERREPVGRHGAVPVG
jgi:hypothetical protein